ncbi:unnamed protein product, partial [Sphagnum jensenii]
MFDVFLNHRGPDVKGGFASHLHQALQEAGCRPFLDKPALEKGQHGQNKIYEALGCASVHVAIFSEHYADSDYCLDELCAMLESKKLIIPVFYDVSPSDLRCEDPDGPYTKALKIPGRLGVLRCEDPDGPYTKALKIHGRRSASDVKKWKEALRMAAELNGFKLDDYNRDEAQLKTAIVSRVRDHLHASQPPPVAPYQVGLEETSKELIEILNRMEKDVGILSLVGMGGIGKTTLAKEIYCCFQKNDMFEKKSFLTDVKEIAIMDLQKQLAHDLFKEDVIGTEEFNKCFNRVMDRKVLIVIDDIDHKRQFDQLIPNINKLCPGSRVIITSRDSNVVNNIMKNENCKYWRHEMAMLSTTDSRHLFNWHAFHSVDPIDGFQELAKNVADACCGLPLALEVIGCFLFDKREECDNIWPETIKALIERKDILDMLMISYNSLCLEERMMFLDIACFMIGQREQRAMQIFKACASDYRGPALSFSSLKDKCLLKLDQDRQIIMHDLLRDMGHQVVKNESRNMEKGTPSHLWDPEMVQRVLQNKEGTNQVRGLSTFGIGRSANAATNVAENYIGMSKLHFLLLDGDNVKGDFSTWSRELSWLQWMNSDLSAVPLELDLRKLAVLDLTSNKELMQIWPNDHEIIYKDLRTLILSSCKALTELPKDIGKLLKLIELNLAFCSSLKALPNSMSQLKELKHLNLSGLEFMKLESLVKLNLSDCFKLGSLPDSIVDLSHIQTFQLVGCHKLENLPMELGKLQSLVELDLSECSELGSLPDSIVDLSQLKTFRLRGCHKLENLPMEFEKLESLVELDLSECSELGSLPDSIVDLSQLKTFRLRGCHKLENLPMEFGKLQSLVELDVSHCSQLAHLRDSIVDLSQLKTFRLHGCHKLENLPMELGKLQSLVELDLAYCFKLGHLPDSIVHLSQLKTFQLPGCHKLKNLPVEFMKLESLVKLNLSDCFKLGSLPDSIVDLSHIQTFQLVGCHKLENLPMELGKLQSLVELDLSECSELGFLPDSIVDLSQLKTFRLRGCHKLENLPMEFEKLESLVELDLSDCSKLGHLPDSIVDLSQLKTFRLTGCHKLENLPMEFGKLQSLVELDLSDCSKLGHLPDSIVDLSQLKTFRLTGCHKLENLPMEFGKLQSLVEFDVSHCSQLAHLCDSIEDLSQLKTFQLRGCHKLENLPMELGKLQSLVEL